MVVDLALERPQDGRRLTLHLAARSPWRVAHAVSQGVRSMTVTLQALLGFIAWTLFLLVLMEAIRSWLVLTGAVPANGFNPDNTSYHVPACDTNYNPPLCSVFYHDQVRVAGMGVGYGLGRSARRNGVRTMPAVQTDLRPHC